MARPGSRRALRRHHRARVMRARERQYLDLAAGGSGATPDPWATSPRRRGALAHTSFFRMCSCGLCASPPAGRVHLPPWWWETAAADALPLRAGHRRMPPRALRAAGHGNPEREDERSD